MNSAKNILISLFLISALVAGCTSEKQLKDQVTKILKENPKLLTDAIRSNPADFVEAFQAAVKDSQGILAKRREQGEQKKLEETYDKPLVPKIRADEAIRGDKNAGI